MRASERAALFSVAVTIGLIVLKFLVWGTTGSLVVLSQALDSVLDLVALGLVYFGVRLATKPADLEHHYGHAKAENLVAFTQTLIIGVVVVFVVFEAVAPAGRGDHGRSMSPGTPWRYWSYRWSST